MKRVSIALSALFSIPLLGCDPGGSTTPDACEAGRVPVRIEFSHAANGRPLRFDTFSVSTPGGDTLSVERLQYYVSGLTFYDMGGGVLFRSDSIWYVDARDSASLTRFEAVPSGWHVHSIGFTFGLDSARNTDEALPISESSLNMAWPPSMGGGYHFLKMEGRRKQPSGVPVGFNTHIGTIREAGRVSRNDFRVESDPLHITLAEGGTLAFGIEMEVAGWYGGVEEYDFRKYGQAMMDDTLAQAVLRRNGEGGAFRLRNAAMAPTDCE